MARNALFDVKGAVEAAEAEGIGKLLSICKHATGWKLLIK
jgi:hypothetical protein